MGEVISFTCTGCGYRAERLPLGPAPHPDRFDPVLASCAACKRLTVVHRPKVGAGCPKCGSALRVEDETETVDCPRCGSRLERELAAIWD